MLAELSGRDHHVHTAVVFMSKAGEFVEETCTTSVTFLTLSDAEIAAYVATGEWQGVAGGYRIQGRAGAYITEIRGSYTAVVGLPIGTVYSMIRRFLDIDPKS
jgi:septum formation protein